MLWVDGVQVATIGYNGNYDAPIAAGSHPLKLTRVRPAPSDVSPEIRLVVQKGQTYTFVAGVVGSKIMLE